MGQTTFHFKQFSVSNHRSAMKVGTDGVLLGAIAGQGVSKNIQPAEILDIGCGTGVISLMLAQRFPESFICGVEIETAAAAEAAENFASSPFYDRLEAIEVDINDFSPGKSFDLIVSNPPFFSETLQSPLRERAQARHDCALPPTTLFNRAHQLLSKEGSLFVIYPATRDDEILFAATMCGLFPQQKISVSTSFKKKNVRTIWEFGLNERVRIQNINLDLRDADGNFSEEYLSLVKDFYTHIR